MSDGDVRALSRATGETRRMKCPACGSWIDDIAEGYCDACGEPLDANER